MKEQQNHDAQDNLDVDSFLATLNTDTVKELGEVERPPEEGVSLTFEEAVETLPPYCDDRDEIDWIRAHPAMARKARNSAMGVIDSIIIGAVDILSPPHGPAPSQSTAYSLQHWVNSPDKFFSQVLQEQKKRVESERKKEEEEDEEDDLDFINQMIKAIETEVEMEAREWEKKIKGIKSRAKA